MDEKWLDKKQLAAVLNVGESWVRNKVTAREIPHRRVGRHVRFAPEDVQAIKDQIFEPAVTATPSRAASRVRRAAPRQRRVPADAA